MTSVKCSRQRLSNYVSYDARVVHGKAGLMLGWRRVKAQESETMTTETYYVVAPDCGAEADFVTIMRWESAEDAQDHVDSFDHDSPHTAPNSRRVIALPTGFRVTPQHTFTELMNSALWVA